MSDDARDARAAHAASGGSPWTLSLGRISGIPIRIHLTFFLLLLWFGTVSAQQGEGFVGGVVFMLLLFGCVVLHELGHALTARRYDVETREIVLYPFGGVARVDQMPSGKAELVIALAGPAVNFVLALLLGAALLALRSRLPGSPEELFGGASILVQLFWANVILFGFNLLPAFPMDGGRVLRATLSLFVGEVRATHVAALIGQGLALLFAVAAFMTRPIQPIWLLIAFFVFVGAGQEAAFQRSRAAVRGLSAREAMVTKFETLAPQDSLARATELLLATHQQDFPVLDAWGRVAGVLHRSALLAALAGDGRDSAVLEVMDREPAVVAPDLPLEEVLRVLQSRPTHPVLVIGPDGLEGMITLENLGELLEIAQSLGRSGTLRIRG
jgi:Zn-dependent protease/predicted transcriptional regulator